MKFKDFISKGEVRKASVDTELVKSIIKTCNEDLHYLDSVKITPSSARKTVSNYYDVLRSILDAIANLDGYKFYSHEAFGFFLKEKGDDSLSIQFDRFRKIRNKINYYAHEISSEEAREYIDGMKVLINKLMSKYLEK